MSKEGSEPSRLKTVIETTFIGEELVEIMVWKFENEHSGSGTAVYTKPGYKR